MYGVYMVYISNPLATLAPEWVDGGYQGSAAFPQERPSTHHTGSSEPVWTGVKGLLPTWFRTPNRPTHNEWLKPTPLYQRPVRRMITQPVGWIFYIIFATCFKISNFFERVDICQYVVRPMSVCCQNEYGQCFRTLGFLD
jgi:hypothetical protein